MEAGTGPPYGMPATAGRAHFSGRTGAQLSYRPANVRA